MKKYLLFIDQINTINQQFSLKSHEIELLDAVAKSHLNKELITIGELIRNNKMACSTTLYNALKNLAFKGLIATNEDKRDGRKKSVSLTKLGLDRYKTLNRLLIQCQ